MSMIDDLMEPCVKMIRSTTADELGTPVTTWTEGEAFSAAITNETSSLGTVAQQDEIESTYKVTTKKSVILKAPDFIKRVSDGEILQITSDGNDVKAPAFFSFGVSQVTAKKWSLK